MTYADVAYIDSYMSANRLVTDAWDVLTNAQKQVASQMATSAIENLNFVGVKTDPNQELQFPRGGDVDIPVAIKNACCEIAYSFADGVDLDFEYDNLRMTSQGFANVRSAYKVASDLLPEHHLNGIPSIIAWRLLLPYIVQVGAIRIERTS